MCCVCGCFCFCLCACAVSVYVSVSVLCQLSGSANEPRRKAPIMRQCHCILATSPHDDVDDDIDDDVDVDDDIGDVNDDDHVFDDELFHSPL